MSEQEPVFNALGLREVSPEEHLKIQAEKAAKANEGGNPPPPTEKTETPAPADTPPPATVVEKVIEKPIEAPAIPDAITALGFKSLDDVKDMREKFESAQKKLKEYESKDPDEVFADSYVKDLNQWLKQGKTQEAFNRVYFSDPSKMSPAEKVAMNLQLKHNWPAEKANDYVNVKYKLGEDYDETDPAVREARMDLELHADDAEQIINQYRQKEMAPAPDRGTENLTQWTPQIPSIMSAFKEIPIEGLDLPFTPSPESIQEAESLLKDVISNGEFDLDPTKEKDMTQIKKLVRNQIIADNHEAILKYQAVEMEKKAIRDKSKVPGIKDEKPAKDIIGEEEKLKNLISQGLRL